ncbi:hypothetical protein PF005_g13297 [Phytophthora fragariae]|nr:hypothetical protein PF003_g7834 [Phytophthora fragariae]KAE9106818.1 hypothetical protein PF007_g13269 [Phytophthora fragariae]KAE9205708.1 hypothetical protein PF005_g13297 [Phytophthora fragariae]
MDDDKEEWLTQLEALEGGIGTSGYKKLCPGAQLRDVGLVSGELGEVGREERIARKGPVHILVKVPGPCAWKLANAKCPLLAFDPKSPIIRIPKAYAEGSGLYVGGDGVVLYLRKEVRAEWTALWKSVVQSYATLWIVGPPGTGKSCAAFAFACSLRRVGGGEKWKVMWIHCSKHSGLLSCILFSGDDEKRTCRIKPSLLGAVLKSLDDYTVVFIDGYVKDRDERKVMWRCHEWRRIDTERRRIVVVSSMVSIGKDWRPDLCGDIPSIVPSSLESSMPIASAPESNTMQEEQLFTMFSWTLEDYQEALKNDELFEHVKNNLTARSSVTMESRMESLEEKFFVAGGSARMMFDESTESAMGSLLSALATVEDLIQCTRSTFGCSSGSVVTRLFSLYPGGSMALSKPGILSSFVAREIGLRTDPTKLQALAQWLAMNPTMDGCMFEMFFFSSLALSF